MIENLIFYLQGIENFIHQNQIQELSPDSDDVYYLEQFFAMIQKESREIPHSEKAKYPDVPWSDLESQWSGELIRAYEYLDLKVMYHLAAHIIPEIHKKLRSGYKKGD